MSLDDAALVTMIRIYDPSASARLMSLTVALVSSPQARINGASRTTGGFTVDRFLNFRGGNGKLSLIVTAVGLDSK